MPAEGAPLLKFDTVYIIDIFVQDSLLLELRFAATDLCFGQNQSLSIEALFHANRTIVSLVIGCRIRRGCRSYRHLINSRVHNRLQPNPFHLVQTNAWDNCRSLALV